MHPYIPEMELNTAIRLDKADWIHRGIIFLTPNEHAEDPRLVLLTAFGSLVIEHFASIIELCRNKVGVGSAMALFRPLLDASLRGQWLYLCADDPLRERFMKRDFAFAGRQYSFEELAKAVDMASPIGEQFSVYLPFYKQMCDYTHTGHDAVYFRMTGGTIEPAFPEERLRLLLTTAAQATLRHFSVACLLVGEPERAHAIAQMENVLKAV